MIVRDMMMRDYRTYGAFLGANEGIATNVLADRLKELEAEGIIERNRDPENRRRYFYSLTAKGCDLAPIVMELIQWGGKHDPSTVVPKAVLNRLKRDPEGFKQEIRERFLGR